MSELPTIAIAAADAPGGYMLINASEFDPELHQRWEDETQPEETAPPGPGPEPDDRPLEDLTLTELRSLASDRKIAGRSGMDKYELIAVLR